jgi:hypothetical protein
MLNEFIKVVGELNITRTNEYNEIVEEVHVPNLVVTSGKVFIANRMINNVDAMSHMAIGTDNTTPEVGQTALSNQLVRIALLSSSSTSNTATYVATFGPGVGTGALTEAGIFSADTDGIMLCRTVFNVINKNASDTVTISWVVTIS